MCRESVKVDDLKYNLCANFIFIVSLQVLCVKCECDVLYWTVCFIPVHVFGNSLYKITCWDSNKQCLNYCLYVWLINTTANMNTYTDTYRLNLMIQKSYHTLLNPYKKNEELNKIKVM